MWLHYRSASNDNFHCCHYTKYLQSDCPKRVQCWSHFYSQPLNIVFFEKMQQPEKNRNLLIKSKLTINHKLKMVCYIAMVNYWLTFSLSSTRCANHNTNVTWNTGISKTVRVKIPFIRTIFKEYLISFRMIFRLIDFYQSNPGTERVKC